MRKILNKIKAFFKKLDEVNEYIMHPKKNYNNARKKEMMSYFEKNISHKFFDSSISRLLLKNCPKLYKNLLDVNDTHEAYDIIINYCKNKRIEDTAIILYVFFDRYLDIALKELEK